MENIILSLASVCSGGAVFWFANQITSMISRPVVTDAQLWQHEDQRKRKLREKSLLYRWFQPLCDDLDNCTWLHVLGNIHSIEASLSRGGSELPWKASEYLAVGAVRTTLTMIFSLSVLYPLFGVTGSCALALIIGALGIAFLPRQLAGLATLRMRRFKQRLPFAIDLMALMMEAGGDFRQCLSTVVHENRGHPVDLSLVSWPITMPPADHCEIALINYKPGCAMTM